MKNLPNRIEPLASEEDAWAAWVWSCTIYKYIYATQAPHYWAMHTQYTTHRKFIAWFTLLNFSVHDFFSRWKFAMKNHSSHNFATTDGLESIECHWTNATMDLGQRNIIYTVAFWILSIFFLTSPYHTSSTELNWWSYITYCCFCCDSGRLRAIIVALQRNVLWNREIRRLYRSEREKFWLKNGTIIKNCGRHNHSRTSSLRTAWRFAEIFAECKKCRTLRNHKLNSKTSLNAMLVNALESIFEWERKPSHRKYVFISFFPMYLGDGTPKKQNPFFLLSITFVR